MACWHCDDTHQCNCIACEDGVCSACAPNRLPPEIPSFLCNVGAHQSCPGHVLREHGRVVCSCACHTSEFQQRRSQWWHMPREKRPQVRRKRQPKIPPPIFAIDFGLGEARP